MFFPIEIVPLLCYKPPMITLMKRIVLLFVPMIFMVCSCSNNPKSQEENPGNDQEKNKALVAPNTLTEAEIDGGWQLLFDGKTTGGWRGFKSDRFPQKGWYVTDGTLMIEYSGTGEQGFAGDIISKQQFSDFDLKLEWKISKGGNSGILLYVTENDDYEATWHTAHEIQVLDDFGYDDVHDYVPTLRQVSGALYDLYTPASAEAGPVGKWNKARIRLEEGHLQHWLNDSLVTDVQLWTDEWESRVAKSKFNVYPDFGIARKGHIGLQDHGQQVWYRNIRVLEL